MNNLEVGEVITLDSGEEFVCFDIIEQNGTRYIYLMTNFTPLRMLIAKEEIENDNIKLVYIKDQKEKEELLDLFTKKHKED